MRFPTVAAVLVVLAGAALWAAYRGFGPAAADVPALRDAVALRTPGLTTAVIVVTTVGSTAAMSVLAAVVGVALWVRGRSAAAVFVLATMATASLVFRLLKISLDRPRPPVATRLVLETNESLPSGHATMSTAVIGSLVVLGWSAYPRVGARTAMVVAGAVWVATVGMTRVYLGVHWFSDVLAGWLVGAAWLAICVAVWGWVTRRSAARLTRPG